MANESTPIGAGDQFRILSNAAGVNAPLQRETGDGWANTGLTATDHEITSDGSAAAAAHFRDLLPAVEAIQDIGEQPLRADTPIPEIFKDKDPSQLRELNFYDHLSAGAAGRQADGSIRVLALSVRGESGEAAADVRPVIGKLP